VCRRLGAQLACGISVRGAAENRPGAVLGSAFLLTPLEQGWARESQEAASNPSDAVICPSVKVLIVHGTSSANILLNNPL